MLWSAPIWVTHGPATVDTTAPMASGSVVGNSGNIALHADALDNVGVTLVTFVIDGVERGSDSTVPFSIPFDSTQLLDGTHSLVVRAIDAATNMGESSPVSFDITNSVPPIDLFLDGFEE